MSTADILIFGAMWAAFGIETAAVVLLAAIVIASLARGE